MIVAFITADLVFPSRIAGITNQLGAPLITAPNFDVLAAKLNEAPEIALAVIDLNSPGADPAAIVPRLQSLGNPPKFIVAFGPHVHEAKLEAARTAGCNLVLTRGQFDAQYARLIADSIANMAESEKPAKPSE